MIRSSLSVLFAGDATPDNTTLYGALYPIFCVKLLIYVEPMHKLASISCAFEHMAHAQEVQI